ncbi:hypothetical protein FRC06_010178 [Ceratobasidium sp. 370]|nr:hypothetical protein FRC06_010178 [Ceratobasidium sp. 370]
MGFALARPTRSQTRAIAALLAPNTSTERHEEIESNTTSLASSHERTEAAPPAQQVPSARSPRKIGGRPLAPRERVAGRAPSRVVAQAGGQTTTGVIKTSSIKTSEESSGAPSGQAPERHAKAEDGEEPENANMAESDSRNPTRSRSKHMIPSELLPRPDTAVIFGPDGNIKQRTFPKGFPIRAKYERWYRRFPVSAYFLEQDPAKAFVLGDSAPKGVCMQPRVGSSALVPNHAHHFNLYTPRFVRGVGTDKVGLCPICVEPVWRGGEGRAILLNTKISAFNYHMQYYHGICSQTGLPFSPPIAFRHKPHKPAHARERSKIEQGKCHSCKQWIQVESIKHGDILVPELHWWKHAASCHGKSRVEGDQNPYLEDAVYMQLREYESRATPEAGSDQWEHAAVSTDQEQAGAGAALTTISASLDKIGESSNVGSGSSLPSTGKKKLLESAGISGNPFGTMDSDSDLTDLNDDG